MPKVFYGSRTRSVTPPSAFGSDDSGSEASTDIEVSRRRPAHRRGESVEVSQPDPKRARTRTARDTQGRRALQKACQRNDIERVKAALAQHADIEDRDYAGTTALHDAALNGNADIVRLLLQGGAVVDVRSGIEELDTPLMDAVASGSVEVSKLLLDAGADPRISNAVGKTAVDFLDEDDDSAGQLSELLESATRALRSKGAPIVDGPTHAQAPPNLFPPGYEARKRAASTNFIDVTRRTGRGIRTDAVAHAAEGNLTYVGLALERGWAPTAEALVKAAKFGHQDVVGLLLAFGLDADAPFEGQTALEEAVQRGHVSTAQLLLQSGSKLDRKNSRGRTYLELVADLPPSDPMRILIEGTKPGAASADQDESGARDPVAASTNVGTAPSRDVKSGSDHSETQPPRDGDSTAVHKEPSRRDVVSVKSATTDKGATYASSAAGIQATVKIERDSARKSARSTAEQKTERPRLGPLSHSNSSSRKASSSLVSPTHVSAGHNSPSHASSSHVSPRHLSSGHTSPGHASPSRASPTQASSTTRELSDSADIAATPARVGGARATHRVSSRSESRPEAFKLADLRAIKPKKRSKSIPEAGAASSTGELASPVTAVGRVDAAAGHTDGSSCADSAAALDARDSHDAAVSSASPIASASPAALRDSPALSPRTDAPPEKARPAVDEETPKWVERSNELAELAKRREKQRLAREARMLESLANEERRRSQEPHSPASQSPLLDAAGDQSVGPVAAATHVPPAVLAESTPERAVSPAVETAAADVAMVSVRHLPYFLRQLSYKDEPLDVAPLYVHTIGDVHYYLDVQVAALASLPQLHAQYPQWPRVLVRDVHKSALWSFCMPWAVRRGTTGAALAAEQAAFSSLAIAWVPKSVVDETLFRGNPPSSVRIRLDAPKSAPKWSALISESDLPLRLQFCTALLQRSPEW